MSLGFFNLKRMEIEMAKPTNVPKSPAVKRPAAAKESAPVQKTGSAQITIDNKAYDLDTLSDEAKNQVASMQFVDAELARLNAQIAVYQTARNGYAAALKELLIKP